MEDNNRNKNVTSNFIFLIPLQLWKQIFAHCFHAKSNHIQRENAIFTWFVALKSASKQLNQILDDRFFFEAGKQRNINLNRVFINKKLQYLIKNRSYEEFKEFFYLEQATRSRTKFSRISMHKTLILIAQHRDPEFFNSFINDEELKPANTNHMSRQAFILALRYANERQTNEMSIAILPYVLPEFWRKDEPNAALIEALKAGKKLNTDALDNFDFWATQNLSPNSAQTMVDQLVNGEVKRMIVPEGELLRFETMNLGSTRMFSNRETNCCVINKRNECIIRYRKRYSREYHDISIAKQTSEHGVTMYTYSGVTSDNLYELIVKSSLADELFSTYPHTYVAVTKESLELPYDQQPWFVGLLTSYQRRKLATDAFGPASFFTFVDENGLLMLHQGFFNPNRDNHELLNGGSIAGYLTKWGLLVGITSTGLITNYRLIKHLLDNDLMIAENYAKEHKINVAEIEPNLIELYMAQKSINEEILIWILSHKIPVKDTTTQLAIAEIATKCSERVIHKLIEFKYNVSGEIYSTLLTRKPRISFDLLKLITTKLPDLTNSEKSIKVFIHSICKAVESHNIMANDYSKRVLVVLAWKYGNGDNYFKLLPKELIDQILSDEYIEEPPYFELLSILSKNTADIFHTSTLHWGFNAFMRFYCKYRYTCSSYLPIQIIQYIAHIIDLREKHNAQRYLYWIKRMLKDNDELDRHCSIDNNCTSYLTRYCMQTSSDIAVEVYDLLLKHAFASKDNLLAPRQIGPDFYRRIPAVWFAVMYNNKKMVKYLIEKDMLPEVTEHESGQLFLSHFLAEPRIAEQAWVQEMKNFIEQCRKDRVSK